MVFIKGPAVLVHQRIAGPGFGDQHHHGVRQRIAAHGEELERVVKAGRVRLSFIGNGPELRQVFAKHRGLHVGLARRHPVVIAAHRVDLAVVADKAVGVRQRPAREGIGGKTLMLQGERRFNARVRQVLVIGAEVLAEHEALVNDGAAGNRHRIIGPGLGAENFQHPV